MRQAGRFTVDDPRFSTARVIGPSMLSLDRGEHTRHRTPFVAPFRARPVRERFDASTGEEAQRLVDMLRPTGGRGAAAIVRGPVRGGDHHARARAGAGRGRGGARLVRLDLGDRDRDHGRDGGVSAGRRRLPSSPGACSESVDDEAGSGSLLAAAAAETELSDRADHLERRRAPVRRDRDDRGHDRQRCAAPAHASERARARLRAAADADGGDRGVAATRAGCRRDRSLRDRGRDARRRRDRFRRPRAGLDRRCEPGPDGVRVARAIRSQPSATHADIWPSRTGRTCASASTSPGSRHGVRCSHCSRGLPGLRLDPDRPSEIRGLVFRKPVELNARWNA